MCILSPALPIASVVAGSGCPAKSLAAPQRQELAVNALAGAQSISELAHEHQVSRRFVYRQRDKAEEALAEAFTAPDRTDEGILFHLPVSEAWLQRLILGLVLICHSSYRGVFELLRDLLGCPRSLGYIHGVARRAMQQACQHNQQQELSRVRIAAHDEIFQAGQPVLVGVDTDSTYCYLLSLEEHRDADTWAIRLLDLRARGFSPQATISDAGSALRAGHDLAVPQTPRRGDVFHMVRDLTTLVRFLENRAYAALATCVQLEQQQARHLYRHGRDDRSLAQKLRHARPTADRAVALADDVTWLVRWLREDVLAVAGPGYAERVALYDFLVAELQTRKSQCPYRLGPLCTALVQQRSALLAFARQLDADLQRLAEDYQVSVAPVRALLQMQALDERDPRRGQQEAALRRQLRGRFYALSEAVAAVASATVRASSVVENLNSRLRCYFFLRRHLGAGYLHLLQFFLNHRRFLRSEHAERVDHSPAELLTGQRHAHWLEMLGFPDPLVN